jgi:hypothetical protein
VRSLWKWFPAVVAALLWSGLSALLQPWASRVGILLYADTALLLLSARYFPRGAAVATVLIGSLFADALRPGPFGLSATLLLPVLLVLLPFQKSLRAWGDGVWLAGTVVLNTMFLFVSSFVWLSRMRAEVPVFSALEWADKPFWPSLQGMIVSASASALLLFFFAPWFASLQTALLALAGNDIHATEREVASPHIPNRM